MHSRVKFSIKNKFVNFKIRRSPQKSADPRRNLMPEYSILKTGSVYINFENHIFTPILIPLLSYLAQTHL